MAPIYLPHGFGIHSFNVDKNDDFVFWVDATQTWILVGEVDFSYRQISHYKAIHSSHDKVIHSIVLDMRDKRIFLAMGGDNLLIKSIDYDGSNERILFQDKVSFQGNFLFDQLASKLSWLCDNSICSIGTKDSSRLIRTFLPLQVMAESYREQSCLPKPHLLNPQLNTLHSKRTSCDFICLPAHTSTSVKYSCVCQTGISGQSAICSKNPSRTLLSSMAGSIFYRSLDAGGASPFVRVLSTGFSYAIDFNAISQEVFWTNGSLYRAALDTLKLSASVQPAPSPDVELVASHKKMIGSFSIDWISGTVFWATLDDSELWLTHLESKSSRLLFLKSPSPRRTFQSVPSASRADLIYRKVFHNFMPSYFKMSAMATDPINGLLFYTVSHATSELDRIEYSWLDGSNRYTYS
ncbi:hypothetical protein Ciccas_002461 [Cichlidogyrus casuarinus]|uniref:Uncharacterized protein n=1 Tax=Cichlidogyrus casuarinus TaxID=1844966 RepID=A0ABD2QH49_9PLAT